MENNRKQLLKVTNITKKFREGTALEHIDFEVKSGEIIGFVGHNGSGKTVLFKCICGFYEVSEGEIKIDNQVVGIGDKMPRNIAFTIEEPALIEEYNARKNLSLLYELNHKRDDNHIKKLLDLVGLDYKSNKKVGKYSLGMKQRLAIAQVLMDDMPYLIFDEPMNGLDKQGVSEIREVILAEKAKGKVILLASHNAADIDYLCDKVYELENGKVIVER